MPGPYDYTVPGAQPIAAGLQGLQGGLQIAQQAQQMQAAAQKQQRQQQYRQRSYALSQNPNATAQDYVDLQAQYPEFAEGIKALNSARSDAQIRGDLNIMQKVNAAISAGQNDLAVEQLNEYSTALKNSGREDEAAQVDSIAEAAKQDPSNVKSSLYQMLLAQMGPKEFTDYYNQQQRLTAGGRAQPVGGGIIIEDPVTKEKKLVTGSFQNGQLTIAGAELPGQLVSRLGESPEEIRKREVTTTQQKAQATIAEKKRTEFYDQYETIQKNINTLDEAISIIEKGLAEGKDLGLGPIRKYFPAWGAAAQRLKNVADRMGLDVVSSVTFGALSEGELNMALRTAKPPDLKGKDLVQWMKDRKNAQEKLAAYLSEAANFIGSPKADGGINTVADWMNYVESRKKGLEAQQQTTELRTQPEQPAGGDRKSQLFNRLMEIQRSKGQ